MREKLHDKTEKGGHEHGKHKNGTSRERGWTPNKRISGIVSGGEIQVGMSSQSPDRGQSIFYEKRDKKSLTPS